MSEHVRERLSAYLDRELAAADHDAVLAHLRGCEACRSHLAALTSVDKAARALPDVEAPARYFDTLPGRVRARLETTSAARLPRPRPPLGRLPVWTWAVAAALLLAVVAPLTLVRERRASLTPPPGPQASPAAPAAPPMTPRAEELKVAAPEKLSQEALPGLQAGAEPKPAARALVVAPPPPPAAYAEPRGAVLESGAAAESPASRAATASAPAAERRQRPPGPGGPYAQAPAQSQAQTQTPLDQAADRVVVESLTEEVAAADAREGARDKQEVARPLAKSAREQDEQGLRGGSALANRVPPADEQEFSRLAAPAAQSVGALRARREAWRTFARLYPTSPRSDEARVRAIEVGITAWRLGHDPVDLGQVRVDAAAYLSRPDAAQAVRVRAILENVGGR